MSKKGRTPGGYECVLRRVKDRNLAIIAFHKSKPCTDCGGVFPQCCMEFDHTRGVKKFGIAGRAYTLKQITEEIIKCDVVCANCHNIRTHKRRIAVDALGT